MTKKMFAQSRQLRSIIAVLPYGPSQSANELVGAIAATEGPVAVRLRRNGSLFRGKAGELIINWGNSNIDSEVFRLMRGTSTLLNTPEAVRSASLKTKAFRLMEEQGVKTTEFTTEKDVAQQWLEEGALVYARTQLQGHSGEGIVMVHQTPENIPGLGNAVEIQNTLPVAPLYTKGITSLRREFRIHVMKGTVTYVQQKKRENNWQENANYSNVVRNYHTGWIYATSGIQPNESALENAVAAVGALGLDFGAVDVITRGDNAWVLEVNTAPGLSGTNLETYTTNFLRIHKGEQPITWSPHQVEGDEALEEEEVIQDPVQGLVDKAFYFVTINGEKTVVQYESGINQLFMIGMDVPIPVEEIGEMKPVED